MRYKIRKRTVLLILTMIILSWLAGFAAFTFHISQMKEEQAAPVDALIVLTGGAGRIGKGLDMLAEKQARHLFITGVNSQVDMQTIMDMWTGENPDLVTCCVTLGHQAHNTRQNAAEARKWISGVQYVRSVRLVTSSYHMPRALLEFRQALPGITIIPVPVAYGHGPDHDQRNFWHLAFAEYNKALLTWLRVVLTPQREIN
ncbi:MAG: YdcF family protein, partial [Alphaproteobacteria bacterium]|nr:YdcF family protein [Alphaproteobacteria bacterium]